MVKVLFIYVKLVTVIYVDDFYFFSMPYECTHIYMYRTSESGPFDARQLEQKSLQLVKLFSQKLEAVLSATLLQVTIEKVVEALNCCEKKIKESSIVKLTCCIITLGKGETFRALSARTPITCLIQRINR